MSVVYNNNSISSSSSFIITNRKTCTLYSKWTKIIYRTNKLAPMTTQYIVYYTVLHGKTQQMTRKPSWHKGSNMAVSRNLGFYRTANSAIQSADSENPSPEPNMEWIRCTACEIFTFKLYCDLETGVWVTQFHRKRHSSIEHIRLYIHLP